jgi:hypothetical protein
VAAGVDIITTASAVGFCRSKTPARSDRCIMSG